MMTTMISMGLTGIGVLVAAACCTTLLHRASASLRHLVWAAALVVLIALPVFETSGLRVEVPLPAAVVELLPATPAQETPAASTVPGTLRPAPREVDPAMVGSGGSDGVVMSVASHAPELGQQIGGMAGATPTATAVAGSGGSRPRIGSTPVSSTSVASPGARVSRSRVTSGTAGFLSDQAAADRPAATRSNRTREGLGEASATPVARNTANESGSSGGAAGALGSGLVVIWMIGVLALLARTLLGHVGARRLVSRGVERASPSASRRFAALCVELGVRRPVRLVVSSSIEVPATWGILRSTVVLPAHHDRWTAATLDRVLLHELAHVRRGDCRTYLLGELARALHWPNPLAWLALSRMRGESERACDDLVLMRGDAPSSYAQDLVSLVRELRIPHPLPASVLTMTEPSGLGRRVRAILDPEQARGSVGTGAVCLSAGFAVGAAFLMSALAPVAWAHDAPAGGTASARTVATVAGPEGEPVPIHVIEPVRAPHVEPMGMWIEPPVVELEEPPAWSAPVFVAALATPGFEPSRGILASGATRFVAPRQSQELCVFDRDGSRSTSINMDDDDIRIRWETNDCRVDIEIEGDVEFLEDDTGIARMGRGATLDIEERIGRTDRRVRFEGEGDGIERRFWVDGDEVAWSDEADRWVAAVLPQLFRHTTINAEARVRRMLEEGGSDRVFAEVEEIPSDHVASRYLELMMDHGSLDEDEYARVIEFAGRIESDHTAGELLLDVVERAGLRPAFQEPMLRAAEGLESDHQKSRVLDALLESDLTTAQLDAVVLSTRTIESDHNLATVLSAVAARGRLDVMDRQSFLDALVSIDSDHNKSEVLEAFLDAGPLSDEEIIRVLEMSESIESDHQRGMILQRIAMEYPLSGAQATAYLRSASQIDSDHQLATTAQAILENGPVDDDQLAVVLAMADEVESDHQRGMVLVSVIESVDLSGAQVVDVLRVTRGLSSDHQLSMTLVLLAEEQELDEDEVADALALSGEIDSDHQRVSVMTALARRYPITGGTLDLYRDLADDLSRHQREQALDALAR